MQPLESESGAALVADPIFAVPKNGFNPQGLPRGPAPLWNGGACREAAQSACLPTWRADAILERATVGAAGRNQVLEASWEEGRCIWLVSYT